MVTYEKLLSENRRWAFREGSVHFEKGSRVHQTLERIAKRLEELGIPYTVAGAMAMFQHGYRRFTEHVDILVSPEGLAKIHAELEGRGYVPPFAGSKNLRDAETGVRIEFLVAGQYPGDGLPKPVVFPDPSQARTEQDGYYFLPLKDLIELKLASGLSSPGRLKDLADVQEMIRVLKLPAQFADSLDGSVSAEFRRLWQGAQSISAE